MLAASPEGADSGAASTINKRPTSGTERRAGELSSRRARPPSSLLHEGPRLGCLFNGALAPRAAASPVTGSVPWRHASATSVAHSRSVRTAAVPIRESTARMWFLPEPYCRGGERHARLATPIDRQSMPFCWPDGAIARAADARERSRALRLGRRGGRQPPSHRERRRPRPAVERTAKRAQLRVPDQKGDIGEARPAIRQVAERKLAADILNEGPEDDTLLPEPALKGADALAEPSRDGLYPQTTVADRARDGAPHLAEPRVARIGLREQLVEVALDDGKKAAVGIGHRALQVAGIEDEPDVNPLAETERCSEDTLVLGDVARAVVSEEHAARAPVAADEPAHDAQPDDRRGLGVLSARHTVRDVEHEFEPSLVSIGLEPDPGTPEVRAGVALEVPERGADRRSGQHRVHEHAERPVVHEASRVQAEAVVPDLVRRGVDEAKSDLHLDRPVGIREVGSRDASGGEHPLRRPAERPDQLEKTAGSLRPHGSGHREDSSHPLAWNVKRLASKVHHGGAIQAGSVVRRQPAVRNAAPSGYTPTGGSAHRDGTPIVRCVATERRRASMTAWGKWLVGVFTARPHGRNQILRHPRGPAV